MIYNEEVLKKFLNRFKMPLLRIICFFILLCFLAGTAQYYLQYRERYNDNSSFQIINFYKEKKNSADAVFIGSSCCFSFYSPLFAYENYGIKTINYSSSGMGMLSYRYAIEEVRKTQKDAMIILTITPNFEMQYLGVHFMSDYMPLSKNKADFLVRYFTQPGESILNSIGFFFPIMEYHDRWSEIEKDDLIIDEGIKGATRHRFYLSTVNDISEGYNVNEDKAAMPERMSFFMNDLLDYCDEKEEKVIFLLPPKTYSEEEYSQMNLLSELITSRGYEILDLRDSFGETLLQMDQDFYDINHTNIHGSIKYTDYLAKFVMSRRDCDVSESEEWNRAVNKYSEIIEPYVLDIETDMKHRDYAMERPVLLSLEKKSDKNVLTWETTGDADSYFVYRDEGNGFKRIGESQGGQYNDTDITADAEYRYTVIGYRNSADGMMYGNYDYIGLKTGDEQ